VLGWELGCELGAPLTLGPAVGEELGALLRLGWELGCELGAPLTLGPAVGDELGALLRLGWELGCELGASLTLGPALGAGLGAVLGTVLGPELGAALCRPLVSTVHAVSQVTAVCAMALPMILARLPTGEHSAHQGTVGAHGESRPQNP
jgi:ABC-type nitrate/sulfonate/bicarbonate transport system permease component